MTFVSSWRSSRLNMTFLPKKIHLNGSDCFHLILERSSELSKEGNNQLYFCIELTSEEALQIIEKNANQSPLLEWIANIELINPQIGVPYYQYSDKGKQITIQKHGIVQNQFPSEVLNKTLSIKKNQLFRLDSYVFEGKNYLMLTLHHVLFDGKGAGMVLQHLTGDLPVTKDNFHTLFPQKEKWKNPVKQWLNLIYVKKAVESTNKGETAYLSVKHIEKSGFELFSHTFSQEETNQIKDNATKNGVRFGLNFFQLACLAKTYRNFFSDTGVLWIPIPYNGRKRGAAGTIISNYMSFIFHRLNVTPGTSLSEIVEQLQQQTNEQLKDELPEKYNRLLQLMRFFPTWFHHLVTTKSSKGKIASFLYSSTEIGENTNERLIAQQWILPPFSYPPGFTVNFYTHKNQLHFHIAYSEKVLDEMQVKTFSEGLIKQLLG